ncbi:MAG: trigger factor [Lachnospiraceae bacterium]|jgi:trigger factor|nr:trigger factor [Lachnospiraceae bacterium]
MSVQVETMEKNLAKLTVQVSAEDLEKAVQQAFLKNKNRFNVPGFRKGKVPRAMIEKMYGVGVFYEDAVNSVIPEAYAQASDESGLEIVSRPEIHVTEVEAGKGVTFEATVAVKPVVTLGQYKGVAVAKADVEATEEEIMAEIRKEQEKNAVMVTVEDRPAAMGDTVTIDYEGFVDGEAFPGGKGEDHPLVLGSHSFIDTFEDQLAGKNVGDDVDVNVTFPEEYHVENLKGKPALFKVKVKGIRTRELPEIDDEFAGEVSDFETLEEYKASIKEAVEKKKADAAKARKEDEALAKIIEDSQMDIPDMMVETQAENMLDDQARRLQSQGLNMQMYMQYTGMTEQMMLDQLKPEALRRIQARLVLEAIAREENIEISEEELEKEFAAMAEAYNMDVDKVKERMGKTGIDRTKENLAVEKAADLIVEQAVETEEPKEEKSEEESA